MVGSLTDYILTGLQPLKLLRVSATIAGTKIIRQL